MPYIEPSERKELARGMRPISVGQLNYAVHKIILDGESESEMTLRIFNTLRTYLDLQKPLQYKHINDVCGVVMAVGLEIARRDRLPLAEQFIAQNALSTAIASLYKAYAWYEDEKMKVNGDIYGKPNS